MHIRILNSVNNSFVDFTDRNTTAKNIFYSHDDRGDIKMW